MSIGVYDDDLVSDAFGWLSEKNANPFIVDIRDSASQFMKENRVPKAQEEKVCAAFSKAVNAYQVIVIGNASRAGHAIRLPDTIQGSHYMVRSAACRVFDRLIGLDRQLIIPSIRDIEYFSAKHCDILIKAEAYSKGIQFLSSIYAEEPRRFIFAQSLLQLQNDARTSERSPEQIWDLIADQYPALAVQNPVITQQRFLANAAQGMPWFEALIGSYENQRMIRTDFSIVNSLFQLVHKDPDEVDSWIHFVDKNQKFVFDFYDFFSEFNEEDLVSALRHLRDVEISKPDNRLIALANKLYVKYPQIYQPNDAAVFVCCSPLQGAIIIQRDKLIALGAQHLHVKYKTIFNKGLRQHPYNIEAEMEQYIKGPNEPFGNFQITQQFRKDYVRYDEVIVADRLTTPLSYPGHRTRAQAAEALLEGLEQLATLDGEMDQRLFFMLQEATAQNLKILACQHWILRSIERDVGLMPNTLLLLNPVKDCAAIERLSDLRIDCTYDFQYKLSNLHDFSQEMFKARITVPIIKVNDKWVYGQPLWIPLTDGAPSLQELYQAAPLEALPLAQAPAQPPPAVHVQAMLQENGDESDDEGDYILPGSSAAVSKPTTT